MKITSTLLVGCGGTGSYLAGPLARLLNFHPNAEPKLTLCDGDAFEDGNRYRQLMAAEDAGVNKALATQKRLFAESYVSAAVIANFLNSAILNRWLLDAGDCPMIVVAVDNDATRKIVCDQLEEAKAYLPSFFMITPGNDAGESGRPAEIKGQTLWWGYTENTDFGINPSTVYPNIAEPSDPAPVSGECSAKAPSQPQLIAANLMAAATTLSVIQSLLDATIDPTKHGLFFTAIKSEVI